MSSVGSYISYSYVIFIVLFIAGCAINLIKRHFVLQLAGMAFFFTYLFIKSTIILSRFEQPDITIFYQPLLISAAGISACLLSMVLGFWFFPVIRKKFRD